jgi:hypothetical protein
MRTLVSSILACAAVAAASGCSDPVRAPLDVNWKFAGLDCDQVGIATIHVDIDREALNPSDSSCLDSRGGVTTGAHLGNFLVGSYRITVTGLDTSGAQITSATVDFRVDRGNNVVQVDAPAPAVAKALLHFSFAGGMTCAEAQVDNVQVFVDPAANGSGGTDAGVVPCNSNGIDGAEVSPLTPGIHSFAIVGLRGNQVFYDTFRPPAGRFVIGSTTDVNVDADAVGTSPQGSASLTFDFGSPAICSGGNWTLTDPLGNPFPQSDATCLGGRAGISATDMGPLSPGLWTFTATAFVGQTQYNANVLFGVPNGAVGNYVVPFTP